MNKPFKPFILSLAVILWIHRKQTTIFKFLEIIRVLFEIIPFILLDKYVLGQSQRTKGIFLIKKVFETFIPPKKSYKGFLNLKVKFQQFIIFISF